MKVNIGIDLGTTNTSVCYFNSELNVYDYLRFDENTLNYFPSMITYRPNEKYPLIGFQARRKMHIKGSHFFLGREIKLHLGDNIAVRGCTIMDLITAQLTAILCKFYEEKNIEVEHIVLTVPAKWMDKSGSGKEIAMLRQAFRTLGFEKGDVSFESEPVAAVAFYCHEVMNDSFSGYCLVVDYGGGTLDATLCHIAQNKDIYVVYTTGATGDAGIGCAGEAFDQEICRSMIERNEIKIPESAMDENGKLNTDSKWFLKMMRSVEEGKISDTSKTTEVLTAYYSASEEEKKQLCRKTAFEVTYADEEIYEVTVEEVVAAFEKVNLPTLKGLLEEIRKFCNNSNIELNADTFRIIPTGGFSGLYCMDATIRQVFNSAYGDENIALLDRSVRSTAIAHGAAILSDKLLSVVPVCREDVGFFYYNTYSEEKKKVSLIKKNTPERDYWEPVFVDFPYVSKWLEKKPVFEIFSGSKSCLVPVSDLCPDAGKPGEVYRFGLAMVESVVILYSKGKNGKTRMKSLEYYLK